MTEVLTRYVLAGGTSELGNRVVKQLAAAVTPQNVTCIVRSTSETGALVDVGVHLHVGDVTEPTTFKGILNPDTVYIDMTHPKYYDRSLEAVKSTGVRRAFFVTTTGIFSKYNHCSDIYKVNEARIKASGIEWTIIRPSLIYGTERDRNMTRLLKFLSRWPMFPVFGDGQCLMQPVHVQDLADGITSAVSSPNLSSGKQYNLCGPTAIPYTALLSLAGKALGRKVKLVHIPHTLAVTLATIGQHLPGFPINKEQVLRLLEDKCFDISLAQTELQYSPREFATGIQEEATLLRSKGVLQ